MKRSLLILFFFMSLFSPAQYEHERDSLIKLLNGKRDTQQVKTLSELTYVLSRYNSDSALLVGRKALQLARDLKFEKAVSSISNAMGIAEHNKGVYDSAIYFYRQSLPYLHQNKNLKAEGRILCNIGLSYYNSGKVSQAIREFNQSVRCFRSAGDSLNTAEALNAIAAFLKSQGQYEKSLKTYFASQKIFEGIKNTHGICEVLNNIGNIYSVLGNDSMAVVYYTESISTAKKNKLPNEAGTALSNLGAVYSTKNLPEKALSFFFESLDICKKTNDQLNLPELYIMIGQAYLKKNDQTNAENYFSQAFEIFNKTNNKDGLADSYLQLGKLSLLKKNYRAAQEQLEKSLNLAIEIGEPEYITECHLVLAEVWKAGGNFKKSLEHLNSYTQIKDSLFNESSSKSMAELQESYANEKKEAEIASLTKDRQIDVLREQEQNSRLRKQSIVLYSTIGGILLTVVLLFSVFNSYRTRKKAGEALAEKNNLLLEQKKILEEKNVLITDSIEYAKGIQETILPSDQQLKKVFPESFVLYLPKDIVAGDFYWTYQSHDAVFLTVADCTGHGVPGAFMSMHSYYLLERIIKEKKPKHPHEILNELNEQMKTTLHQTSKDSSAKYGIDMGLIKLQGDRIEFAGARNPLLIIHKKEIQEIKADRIYVGASTGSFCNHELNIENGSMMYLFTDGYADQKGGPENKKFFATTFRELLISIADLSMEEQKEKLKTTFEEWKGKGEQIDDVLIFGIRQGKG